MPAKKGSRIRAIRALLRAEPDGMTVHEIEAEMTRVDQSHISRILRAMPDSYIDRWIYVEGTRWARAVWCVVVPPEDCPRPKRKDEYL